MHGRPSIHGPAALRVAGMPPCGVERGEARLGDPLTAESAGMMAATAREYRRG